LKPVILFVVGAPGVGKTTIVRNFINHPFYPRPLFTEPPEPKWTVVVNPDTGTTPIAAVGWYKGETFDGGDTVPYSGAKAALEFWQSDLWQLSPELTIFDGARFATGPSYAYVTGFAEEVGAAVACVHLVALDAQLVARRQQRGSNQAPAWIKGATTSARNFAKRAGAVTIEVADVAAAVSQVRRVIADAAALE
jgi:hypothetical protein